MKRLFYLSMATILLIGLLPVTVGAQPVTAAGEILLEQLPDQVTGWFADVGWPASEADNFALAEAQSIAQIQIWGAYWPDDIPYPDQFTVIFHADAGGLPGAVLYSESGVASTREQTGAIFLNLHEYLYTLTLADPVALGPGTYWVEVYNNGYFSGYFTWETGSADTYGRGLPNKASASQTPGTGWYTTEGNFALRLIAAEVDVDPDIRVEPASLSAEQCSETQTTQTLQICNDGAGDLTWSLSEAVGAPLGKTTVTIPAAGARPESAKEAARAAGAAAGRPESRVEIERRAPNSNPPDVLLVNADDDNGAGWFRFAAGFHPDLAPHGGAYLALFNPWYADFGTSARLETGALDLSGTASPELDFWMSHDTSYPDSDDRVQVQVSTDGTTWTNVGAPVSRYDASCSPACWQEHTVSLAGYDVSGVYIGFLGISEYGSNFFLDDTAILDGGDTLPLSGFEEESFPPPGWTVTQVVEPVSPIRELLAAYGDLGAVDRFDARVTTPTLAELLPYEVVLTWSDLEYANAAALGDVLADYVDAGGKVINSHFSMSPDVGWALAGRFVDESYVAMWGTTGYVHGCLGTFDPLHPIMAGVSAVCDSNGAIGPSLTAGSSEVARWEGGELFVAAKDNRTVVSINAYYGIYDSWTGQMPDVVHNAILWLATPAVPDPLSWLGEDPSSGTVAAGACADVTVSFDSTGMSAGTYAGTLLVDSNDPDTPQVTVPVDMTVLAPPSGVDFSWDPAEPVVNQEITFTGTAQGSEPLTYVWDWGDGGAGGGAVATHAYAAPGDYLVTLTVSNDCDSVTMQQVVHVYAGPVLRLDPTSLAREQCPGVVGSVWLQVCNDGDLDLVWGVETAPSWVSWAPSSGTVAPGACQNVESFFDSTGLAPGYYSGTVHGTWWVDSFFDVFVELTVDDPVHDADFSWDPSSPIEGQEVTFTGSALGTGPIDYAWDWGDGTTGSGNPAQHTYATAGDYVVTLTASNGCGSVQAQHTVTIAPASMGTMHVQWIKMRYVDRGMGRYLLRSQVRILDEVGNAVDLAAVDVEWTAPDSATTAQQRSTNLRGIAGFALQTRKTGLWQLCVTDVAKAGWTYDPGQNQETCKTITVPLPPRFQDY